MLLSLFYETGSVDENPQGSPSTFRSLSQRSGATNKEDVARIDVFSGDHAEDVEVLGTVRQGQFYLHAVIIGIGEDAVLRYVLYRRPLLQRCLLSVYRQYHKKIGWFTQTKVSQSIRP